MTKSRKRRKNQRRLATRIFWEEFRGVMRCWYCERPVSKTNDPSSEDHATVDHRIPLSKGGENKFHNMVLACRSCNMNKANKIVTHVVYK